MDYRDSFALATDKAPVLWGFSAVYSPELSIFHFEYNTRDRLHLELFFHMPLK